MMPAGSWTDRTMAMDETLRRVMLQSGCRQYALMAMGSYGRRELAPWSDKDLLLVLPDTYDDAEVHTLVHALEDSAYRTGVVARTIVDALAMLDADLRSWLAMIEARFICGDTTLANELRMHLAEQIAMHGAADVEQRIASYARDRHKQYGDSVKLLEPNIKNSAGALRDLQAMYYLALVEHITRGNAVAEAWPMFDELAWLLPLHAERIRLLIEAWRYFLLIRETMHDTIGRLHDVLDYDLQKIVAERLGCGPASEKDSVETFMRAYYQSAKEVRLAFDTLFVSKEREESTSDVTELDMRYVLADSTVHLRSDEQALCGDDVIDAFLHVARTDATLGSDVVRAIDAMRAAGTLEFTDRGRMTFDVILRQQQHVAMTLRRMNDTNVLGAILPAFGDLVTFFQHNIYHYYTADEHTLIAIEHAEELAGDDTLLGDLFRSLSDRSPLYYAILFHDIAKPVDLQRHEIFGADMALETLELFGRMDIADDVAVVVRFHLLMEQIAFRRNYHDRAMLVPFAQLLGSEHRLALLYMLTYADMSALNPTVWTQWKGAVLEELFLLARKETGLRGSTQTDDTAVEQDTEGRTEGNGNSIGSALRMISSDEDIQVLFSDYEAHTEALVVGRDAPYFLSRIAAVFLAADVSIIAANVETRADGIAADTFRVVDIIGDGVLRAEQKDRTHALIREVWRGTIDTEQLFRRQREKWKRRLRRAHNPGTRIDVEFHDHVAEDGARQTIVDVYAPDSFGLLYKLTQIISSFRLTILFATIATRVDGVVDSFYVTDVDGTPFDNDEARAELRTALLEHIEILTRSA